MKNLEEKLFAISDMKLGKETDSIIAEKIFKMPFRKPTHGPCCTCQTCGWDFDNCQCGYGKCIEMTWRIVKELRKKNIKLVLFENQSGNEYHNYYAYLGKSHPLGQEPWIISGETVEEAICLAALMTVQ